MHPYTCNFQAVHDVGNDECENTIFQLVKAHDTLIIEVLHTDFEVKNIIMNPFLYQCYLYYTIKINVRVRRLMPWNQYSLIYAYKFCRELTQHMFYQL